MKNPTFSLLLDEQAPYLEVSQESLHHLEETASSMMAESNRLNQSGNTLAARLIGIAAHQMLSNVQLELARRN